jgi:hypothetical protein
MDIEGAFRRNVDGAWAKLRYWSVVNRDVAKCGGGKKFWRIKYTESIIVIGDPEDGRLIAPQLRLMRLESLPGDVDLCQIDRRPIDRRDKRWSPLASWSRRKAATRSRLPTASVPAASGHSLQNVTPYLLQRTLVRGSLYIWHLSRQEQWIRICGCALRTWSG